MAVDTKRNKNRGEKVKIRKKEDTGEKESDIKWGWEKEPEWQEEKVCVCVCVRERERERDRGGGRCKREIEVLKVFRTGVKKSFLESFAIQWRVNEVTDSQTDQDGQISAQPETDKKAKFDSKSLDFWAIDYRGNDIEQKQQTLTNIA